MTETARPAIDGWFTTGAEPALVASRCTTCGVGVLPADRGLLPQPRLRRARSSRRPSCPGAGRCGPTPTRSTSRRRRTSPPPIPTCRSRWPQSSCPRASSCWASWPRATASTTYAVGAEVELVVETLYADESGERTIWRWKPVAELGEEADQ